MRFESYFKRNKDAVENIEEHHKELPKNSVLIVHCKYPFMTSLV